MCMLIVNQNYAVLPDYVLKFYKNFITENELITLMFFQIVPEGGNIAQAKVAEMLGYQSKAPLTATLNRLEEKGAIAIHRGNIDASPLWAACAAMAGVTDDDTPTVETRNKKDKYVTEKVVYTRIKDKIDKANYWQWLATLKNTLKELTEDEVVDYIGYIEQRNKYIQIHYKREFYDPVSVYMVTKYLTQWVEKGKPKQYQNATTKFEFK